MLGIIGGSGLTDFPDLQNRQERAVVTPYGAPSSTIVCGDLNGMSVAFLARHGRPHVIPPHCVNYRANIWALQQLGVDSIIAVYAVGGISLHQDAGVISVPDQIIDYTWGREHTYSESAAVPLQHVDFSFPYSNALRQRLLAGAASMDLAVIDGAVYAATQGPRLETAAEIRRLARDGGDIVGMTGMPEAALVRECGLDFAALALVVNKAAGLSADPITMADMEAVMHSGMGRIRAIIAAYCLSANGQGK